MVTGKVFQEVCDSSGFKRRFSRWASLLVLAAAVFLGHAPAEAHRIIVFAWVEGETVHVESKFHGGKQIRGGAVEVSDDTGKRLLSGETDEQGHFTFQIPRKSALTIAVRAGEGHRGEWRLPLNAIEPTAEVRANASQSLHANASTEADVSGAADGNLPPKALQHALEAALDKKLKPLVSMVADLHRQGPTLKDVLAGLGYIMGLVGIVLYLQARRSARKDKHDS